MIRGRDPAHKANQEPQASQLCSFCVNSVGHVMLLLSEPPDQSPKADTQLTHLLISTSLPHLCFAPLQI